MSHAYRQLRWIAVLFTIAAAIAIVVVILIAAFDFDFHWTNQDWSAAGTIAGAAMTLAAVVVALSQNRQIQKAAIRDREEARRTEEHAAIETVARTASSFSARIEATAEAFLQQLEHNRMAVEVHAAINGPDAPATVAEVRSSFEDVQRIIQQRREVVLAAHEAQTTISLTILRMHTLAVQARAMLVLGQVQTASKLLEPADGQIDWDGVAKSVPAVRDQVALLLRDYGAPRGLVIGGKAEKIEA
ncbi:hypothetical protein [Prescottella equi]|uniref:hypothetical protein n=1 Tax=Rhodococcus hoagii TaxID=43767 RepID=UPI00197E8DB3|nr:hypothetical protein [Prescottella equi]